MRKRIFAALTASALVLPTVSCGSKKEEETPRFTDSIAASVTGGTYTITSDMKGRFTELDNCLDYYYSKLNDDERVIYDYTYDAFSHCGDTNYKCDLIYDTEDYSADEFQELFGSVTWTVTEDHPEIYPMDKITLHFCREAVIDSYFEPDSTLRHLITYMDTAYENWDKESAELEKSADEFITSLELETAESDEEKARRIYDKLIETVDYDYVSYESEKANPDKVKDDYYRTVYAALVGNPDRDGAKEVCCEGYAAAFQYLMKRAGIVCARVSGTESQLVILSDKSEHDYGTENHRWNIALIDGRWREFDVNFDDATITHNFFMRTTEDMKNIDVAYEDKTSDGKVMVDEMGMPMYFHIIYSHDRLERYRNDLLPIAE